MLSLVNLVWALFTVTILLMGMVMDELGIWVEYPRYTSLLYLMWVILPFSWVWLLTTPIGKRMSPVGAFLHLLRVSFTGARMGHPLLATGYLALSALLLLIVGLLGVSMTPTTYIWNAPVAIPAFLLAVSDFTNWGYPRLVKFLENLLVKPSRDGETPE